MATKLRLEQGISASSFVLTFIGFLLAVISTIFALSEETMYFDLQSSGSQDHYKRVFNSIAGLSIGLTILSLLTSFAWLCRNGTSFPYILVALTGIIKLLLSGFGLNASAKYYQLEIRSNRYPFLYSAVFAFHTSVWIFQCASIIYIATRRPLRLYDLYQPVISRSKERTSNRYIQLDHQGDSMGPLWALAKEHERIKFNASTASQTVQTNPEVHIIRRAHLPPPEPRFDPLVSYWSNPKSKFLALTSQSGIRAGAACYLAVEYTAAGCAYDLSEHYLYLGSPLFQKWIFYLNLIFPLISVLAIFGPVVALVQMRLLPTERVRRWKFISLSISQLIKIVWVIVVLLMLIVNSILLVAWGNAYYKVRSTQMPIDDTTDLRNLSFKEEFPVSGFVFLATKSAVIGFGVVSFFLM